MFTIYSFIILYWLFTSHILGWYVPVGVMTLAFVIMIIENKFFHKYNIVGIRFGRLLQKYVTTKEPLDYQVDICVKGMKELIEKEEEYGKQKG